MIAELDEVSSPRARREFATGCLRSLVVSLPAAAAASFASGLLSVALVMAALLRYPGLVDGPGTWVAVGLFLCVILGYVVVAMGLAAHLVDQRLRIGAAAAAAVTACSWMGFGFSASTALPTGVPVVLLGLGLLVAATLGWWATTSASSLGKGFQCVGLASLLAGSALFLLWAGQAVVFAGRPYDPGMVTDFRTSGASDLATYAVNDSLGSGMMLLVVVPLVSCVAGVVGALSAPRGHVKG